MKDTFASAEILLKLKKKFEDEDLTLSREQVSFLFNYVEALELALNYACEDEGPEVKHRSLEVEYVREALTPLPELEDDAIHTQEQHHE